ncbi:MULTISPECIES: SPOR domain-containing protein [Meiothermus]|uniref:SPOR domain-containing protein n=1 Tax=Meiothermus TaxID=65551 RepID=UPI0003D5EDAD|nr:SPOR domain-containing protein [Meiothermus ruber]
MGWIRANWLDALIFLLVAAIMAGVVFFLVGVNPFSGPQGNPAPPPTAAPQPQTAPATPPPEPQTPAPAQSKPQPQTEPEPVVTLLPVPQAPTTSSSSSKPVPAPPKVTDRSPTSPQPTTRSVAPSSERPSLSADAGGGWRVVVGAFGDRENAERLTTTLRQQGYPVGLEAAGNLTRVWVGPYSTQDRARAVAGTLEQYQPQVGRVPTPTPRAETTPEAGRYLQVGAFRKAQSAQAVIEAVRQAGYPVVLVEEGGLVKVRVGPLEDTTAAATDLRARGLEVLEVR